jgi:hypothetical protein
MTNQIVDEKLVEEKLVGEESGVSKGLVGDGLVGDGFVGDGLVGEQLAVSKGLLVDDGLVNKKLMDKRLIKDNIVFERGIAGIFNIDKYYAVGTLVSEHRTQLLCKQDVERCIQMGIEYNPLRVMDYRSYYNDTEYHGQQQNIITSAPVIVKDNCVYILDLVSYCTFVSLPIDIIPYGKIENFHSNVNSMYYDCDFSQITFSINILQKQLKDVVFIKSKNVPRLYYQIKYKLGFIVN